MATKMFLALNTADSIFQRDKIINMALVSEDGKMFYAEFSDFKPKNVNDETSIALMEHLKLSNSMSDKMAVAGEEVYGDKATIIKCFNEWIEQFDSVKMCCENVSDKWFSFVGIFGNLFDLPDNINGTATDLSTYACDEDDFRIDTIPEFIHLLNKQDALRQAYELRAKYLSVLK